MISTQRARTDGAVGNRARRNALATPATEHWDAQEIGRALRAAWSGQSDGRSKEEGGEWRRFGYAVRDSHRQVQRVRRRGDRTRQRRRACTEALAKSTAAGLPGTLTVAVSGRIGRVFDAAGAQRGRVIRAMRERVRSAPSGHRVSHREMDGCRNLAQERKHENQPTVSKSHHG
jgi:hypothetical protein